MEMSKWCFILVLFSVIVSCSNDDASTPPDGPARRTVVVYMSAENDLGGYGFLTQDISEMKRARSQVAPNENLVLFVDMPSSREKPFIAKVTTTGQLDTLYRYDHDFYASDPGMMAEVLNKAIALCPATEDYGLVLWGHANGWIIETDSIEASRRAYGRDDGTDTGTSSSKWLNIPSLRKTLEATGIKWKFILADCCNMINAETAYELRDRADYLIGAPSEIPGVGAPYLTVLKDLFLHNDEALYTSICDDYHAQLINSDCHTPTAAVRMEMMPALAEATREILPKVNDFMQGEGATQGMIYYYSRPSDWMSDENEKTLYDMNDVVRTALGADSEAYKNWKKVLDETVIYKRESKRWQTNKLIMFSDFTETTGNQLVFKHGDGSYGGMSMFFPMDKYKTTSHQYNETIKKMAWYYAVGWSALGW